MPNLAVAIAIGMAWIALVEGLVAQVVGTEVARWLPLSAGQALESVIAAIALANGLPLYTCNPDDFAGIDGLVASRSRIRTVRQPQADAGPSGRLWLRGGKGSVLEPGAAVRTAERCCTVSTAFKPLTHNVVRVAPSVKWDLERETGLEPATFSLEGLSVYAQ